MNRRNFSVLALSAASLSSFSQENDNRSINFENTDLYLLIGQSNMSGRGDVEDVDKVIHERVFYLNRIGSIDPAIDPIHFDKPKVAGVGPGRTFGIYLSNYIKDRNVLLVPCAVGGSPIDSWKPNYFYAENNCYPYDDMVKRIKSASQFGRFKGILWHQGESDSNLKMAGSYKGKLIELISNVRQLTSNPQIPFLIGQMGQWPEKPWDEWRKAVNESQIEICNELENVKFVSSQGLRPKKDLIHFDSASARILGERFAKVFLNI